MRRPHLLPPPTRRSRFPIRKLSHLVELRRKYFAVYTELMRRRANSRFFLEAPREEVQGRNAVYDGLMRRAIDESRVLGPPGRRLEASSFFPKPPQQPVARRWAGGGSGGGRPRGAATQDSSGRPRLSRETAEALAEQLKMLECKLTLAQVVTFRTCVALKHSRHLMSQMGEATQAGAGGGSGGAGGHILRDWRAFIDMMSIFVDAHPNLEDDDEPDAAGCAEDEGGGKSVVSIKITCPRIGVSLVTPPPPPAPKAAGPAASASSAAAAAGRTGAGGDFQQQPQGDGRMGQEYAHMRDRRLRSESQTESIVEAMVKGLDIRIPNSHYVLLQVWGVKVSALDMVRLLENAEKTFRFRQSTCLFSHTVFLFLQASTIRVGASGTASTPYPQSLLRIPARRRHLDATAPRYDGDEQQQQQPQNGSRGGSGTEHDAGSSSVRQGGGGVGRGNDWGDRYPIAPFISSSDPSLFRGTLYPDAPISEYLPRCKVRV